MTTRKQTLLFLLLGSARFILTVAVFYLLIAASARLVMTPLFLQLEYGRPGFPEDPYGLSVEDRLHYAPPVLDYLIYNQTIDSLASLFFPDGLPLFNSRELDHMMDVQRLTAVVFSTAVVIAFVVAVTSLALRQTGHSDVIRCAFRDAGLLTLGLIGLIVVFAVSSWNAFFTGFHTAFFADGTWYFAYSDTLIRLFPEQFWFDAALAVGLLAALGALCLIFVTWRMGRSA